MSLNLSPSGAPDSPGAGNLARRDGDCPPPSSRRALSIVTCALLSSCGLSSADTAAFVLIGGDQPWK